MIVRKQGRHKYFQLHDRDVAELLEKLLNITSNIDSPKSVTGPSDPRLRRARICYDHLAGEFGVDLYDSLVLNKLIIDKGNETIITAQGESFFHDLGVNFEDFRRSKRPLCKSCLDWSERSNHLAGHLGQWVLTDLLNKGWASKDLDSRAILFTQKGLMSFSKTYGISNLLRQSENVC